MDKVDSRGYVLAEIIGAMYGLPQAGRIAYDDLKAYLELADYVPTGLTPGLFKHKTRPILFLLVVDDFGIKYLSEDDLSHLLDHLRLKYDVTVGDGSLFCGIHLDWNYNSNPRKVKLSIPKYCHKALTRFQHPKPARPQHSPHAHTPIQYGAKIQMAPSLQKEFAKLTKQQQTYVQEVVGVFLFYARAIDNTMLTTLGTISSGMNYYPYTILKAKIDQFLDYVATHPNAALEYIASEMHLWTHTDSSYLNEPKARSRAGGYHFLSDKPKLPITPNSQEPTPNAPVHILCKIINAVMSSAQESETGAGYLNAKDAIPMRTALEEMGHPQGPTPLQFDNKVATQLLNDDAAQKRSKAMDMRFYWLKDRDVQKQFHIHWRPGSTNLADYPTKHHPTSHHINERSKYVSNLIELQDRCSKLFRPTLQGCA